MFDSVTTAFMREAPPLPGLNPAQLSETLTAAHVDIAAARLAALDGASRAELAKIADHMAAIADTYEAFVTLGIHTDKASSASFVAGSARQAIALISRISEADPNPTLLNDWAVGPEIAAGLLFLIAERSSDAFEAARYIRAKDERNAVRRALILALRRFCRGEFVELSEMKMPQIRVRRIGDTRYATDLLFIELFKGLIYLAQAALGLRPLNAIDTAQEIFEKVRALSLETTRIRSSFGEVESISLFAGPHHLALLLIHMGKTIRRSFIINTPPPVGSDDTIWNEWLTAEAKRWPFIWQNHREAIATGYLNRGCSLVMTTPTGSGKTTLAALKIAATLAAGKTVLYLAPTRALVGQIEHDLRERLGTIRKAQSIEELAATDKVETLPDIAVVTPERCYALLIFAPELFQNVGLLVFDECHLLGASTATPDNVRRVDRRSIDAMLCLLTFMTIGTSADYLLLSAMVSNGEEFAAWLQEMLKRPVLSFDDKWKPTRQLRSCVMYAHDDLTALRQAVRAGEKKPKAIPYGLFSLVSGWHPETPEKFLLRPFTIQPVSLGLNKHGHITANRLEAAMQIARPFADAGLKVLIFCDSIRNCVSVAKNLNDLTPPPPPPPFNSTRNEEQNKLRDTSISELGAVTAIYDAGTTRAAVHHGELLTTERRLVETLFRDKNSGLNILAATSTLAQGLNLPCEVVILAGTDRLSDNEKGREQMHAHEILNALGRAGRAGHAATGLSIVIPGNPIGCNPTTKSVSNEEVPHVVFSEGDQCIPLIDPLTTLYDLVDVNAPLQSDVYYLLRRLAVSLNVETDGIESFEKLTRRSFGFFQKARANREAAEMWLNTRKTILATALERISLPIEASWHEELAAKTGATPGLIALLAASLENAPMTSVNAQDWIEWLLTLIEKNADDIEIFFRAETLEKVFARAYTNQDESAQRKAITIHGIIAGLKPWLEGKPLIEIETIITDFIRQHEGNVQRPIRADVKAKHARRFATRLVPDIAFICSVLSEVAAKISADTNKDMPAIINFIPQLIRRGIQTPYHLVLLHNFVEGSRPDIQNAYQAISASIESDSNDNIDAVRAKVDNAQLAALVGDIDFDFDFDPDPDPGTDLAS